MSSSISCKYLATSYHTRLYQPELLTVPYPLSFLNFSIKALVLSKSERWIIGPWQQTRNLDPGRWFFVGDSNTSALAEHAINTGHTIDWNMPQTPANNWVRGWSWSHGTSTNNLLLSIECVALFHQYIMHWNNIIMHWVSCCSHSLRMALKCRNYSFLARDQGCQELLLVFLATQASIVKESRCCANRTTIGHISHTYMLCYLIEWKALKCKLSAHCDAHA